MQVIAGIHSDALLACGQQNPPLPEGHGLQMPGVIGLDGLVWEMALVQIHFFG